MLKEKNKKILTFILAIIFLIISPAAVLANAAETTAVTDAKQELADGSSEGSNLVSDAVPYKEFLTSNESAVRPAERYTIKSDSFTAHDGSDGAIISDKDKGNVFLWTNEQGYISSKVNVKQAGLYNIKVEYSAKKGKSRQPEFAFLINGKLQYKSAYSVNLQRMYRDVRNGGFERDNQDNDMTPESVCVEGWQETYLYDSEGLITEPLQFYFNEGENSISVYCITGSVAISSITIENRQQIAPYQSPDGEMTDKYFKTYQGEDMTVKSDASIKPVSDRSNSATFPSDPVKIRLNSVSGANFKYPLQYIEWEVEVPENGYYKLGARYKQDYLRGFPVNRIVTVNGEIPFSESQFIGFSYSGDFVFDYFGKNDTEFGYYLNKGKNKIRMTVSLGEFAPIISELQDCVANLNTIYRKIVQVTGTYPDTYRDYKLQAVIPNLVENLTEVSAALKEQVRIIEEKTGMTGSESAVIETLYHQLDSFAAKPNTIPERLTKMKDNISALASLILTIKEQPLDIDYIAVAGMNEKIPDYKPGFVSSLIFNVKAFFGSFFVDYTNVGSTFESGEKTITVWVGTGRDQANAIKALINNSFSKESSIQVNLSVVQGALLQATMAGKGPDVALNIGRGDPINLGMRGALQSLDQFEGFQEVLSGFMKNAMVPYQFEGKTYALPETQNFHMMFYRSDVLKELGVTPPQTWEELYLIAPILQNNNMDIGLPYAQLDAYSVIGAGIAAQSIFPTFLLQSGGSFYTEDLHKTALTKPEAFDAFKMWTDFYNQYSFPLFKDDYSRFRTGEMPIVINFYSFYNQLAAAAPEIKGLWEMVPVPGMKNEDGSINRSEAATGTASIMLNAAKDKESAWKFIRWWAGSEAQTGYSDALETMMGIAGRNTPANLEAFQNIGWSDKEMKNLTSQWNSVVEIPEVPGGYYTSRNLDNAFKAVVYKAKNAREQLYYWDGLTNEELNRKWKEFGNKNS